MKYITPMALAFMLSLKSFAQVQIPFDTATGKVSFTEIVYADALSKKDLYNRALQWLGQNNDSAKDVMLVKNPEEGKIVVKRTFTAPYENPHMHFEVEIHDTMVISFKEGRCRVQLTNFTGRYYLPANELYAGGWQERTFESIAKLLREASSADVHKQSKNTDIYSLDALKGWNSFFAFSVNNIHGTLDSFSAFMQKSGASKTEW